MDFSNTLNIGAVVVPSRFISEFMQQASGDYVKVYLSLLHNGSADIQKIAEELCITERDVNRAVRYWQDKGVIMLSESFGETASGNEGSAYGSTETVRKKKAVPASPRKKSSPKEYRDPIREFYRGTDCTEAMLRLAEDPEFEELSLIVQKYRRNSADEEDSQVLMYLYDGLKLPADVIEYLVEYAVENHHDSNGYLETLGRDWAQKGISTVEEAKKRTKQVAGSYRNGAKKTSAASAEKAAAKAGRAGERHTDYTGRILSELLGENA